MKIIDKIEISYFRSIYTLNLRNCGDINIFTGANDAGKSNILKALNLFFNNETEPHSEFNFLRDLCRYRETEARAAKGRMTIWIRITFLNYLAWQSLPERFTVRKTWNRYELLPQETVSDTLSATALGRFLAKLKFHYIPAVRSRDIFSDLLADLHDTLLQDESAGLRQSSDALVNDLHDLTDDMSQNILNRVKIDSKIDLPESLADLFRSLNFVTKFGEHEIPLILRGDGLQSRHLPFILAYISEKSNKHHIWGYEEPENSLELSRAFEMSHDFLDTFSKNNQIFLTTHSPAFYDLGGERVRKWYTESLLDDEIVSTKVTPITATHEVDRTMGLLNVITPRLKSVYEETRVLKDTLEEMEATLRQADSPIVYVEGITDATILNHAKKIILPASTHLTFLPANGASDITQFLKVSTRIKADQRPLVGLFDSDARGRKEFMNFNKYHLLEGTEFRVIDRNKNIFVGLLQVPTHLQEPYEEFRRLKLDLPLPIEFMFRETLIQSAIAQEILVLKSRQSKIANEELPLEITVDEIFQGKVADNYIYLTKEIDSSCKVQFAEWIVQQNDEEFDPFENVMNSLAKAIG